ncbi:hypothetical protein DV704_06220 [Meiothermus sp. QL-1]|nr:hypothetical protein DV704_06220 [Meiothermus sp. QL-1]
MVYDVGASLPILSVPLAAGEHPVVVRLAQAVAAYYALRAQPLPGYGAWLQQEGVGSTAVYVSQRRGASGQVEATVEMRWRFAVRPDGLGSVRLETRGSEPIDVGSLEGPALAWLDREFRRVSVR